jgi:hypothetical protein
MCMRLRSWHRAIDSRREDCTEEEEEEGRSGTGGGRTFEWWVCQDTQREENDVHRNRRFTEVEVTEGGIKVSVGGVCGFDVEQREPTRSDVVKSLWISTVGDIHTNT